MTTRFQQTVEINGFHLVPGSAAVHFYYSPAERLRLLGFLLDGVRHEEGVVLACTPDGYVELFPTLKQVDLGAPASGLLRVEITSNLMATIRSIAATARGLVRKHGRARVLADFGAMVGKESIFELEGALGVALGGLNLVTVTQYDGNVFDASVTIEQFRTHALCIMGNAFYHENRNFTSAESYYRRRAAGSRK